MKLATRSFGVATRGASPQLANVVHGWGGRVIAVGTTVVRALESVAEPGGGLTSGEGWTNLVVTAERGLWAVDGLLTGWHEPEASHLQMLRAASGDELLERSYQAAIRGMALPLSTPAA